MHERERDREKDKERKGRIAFLKKLREFLPFEPRSSNCNTLFPTRFLAHAGIACCSWHLERNIL